MASDLQEIRYACFNHLPTFCVADKISADKALVQNSLVVIIINF